MERFNFLNAKVTLREFGLVLVALALFFLSLFISKSRQKQHSLDILMLVYFDSLQQRRKTET